MNCQVCGRCCHDLRCGDCSAVAELCRLSDQPLYLIVDGSFSQRMGGAGGMGGAGMVLVKGNTRGHWVALCACWFSCKTSLDAEVEAVMRGALWAPGVPVYSDSTGAIDVTGRTHPSLTVRWIQDKERGTNHYRAHLLSVQGRQGACRVVISK